MRNVGWEEAGKFLVLIDLLRAPNADQKLIGDQAARAANHLAKLLYAQMADYSIGDRRELLSALATHRQAFHLDGPNDFDWIFPNELISDRERALYVDLVEADGVLIWLSPFDYDWARAVPKPMTLVRDIAASGLISPAGFESLRTSWATFDHEAPTGYGEWTERSRAAFTTLAETVGFDATRWRAAERVISEWPMPLVYLDLHEEPITIAQLEEERERQKDA